MRTKVYGARIEGLRQSWEKAVHFLRETFRKL